VFHPRRDRAMLDVCHYVKLRDEPEVVTTEPKSADVLAAYSECGVAQAEYR
jgi:hypothetical protein